MVVSVAMSCDVVNNEVEARLAVRILIETKTMKASVFGILPLRQVLLGLIILTRTRVQACACYAIHPAATASSRVFVASRPHNPLALATGGLYVTGKHYFARSQKPLIVLAGACILDKIIKHEKRKRERVPQIFATQTDDEDDMVKDQAEESPEEQRNIADEAMSGAMVASIGFYKHWISPLLPPACRFVPTCSQYGVQAIKDFGPSKGAVLIAWRLLRCSPIGGKGYDPPRWPPVSYTYSSY